MLDKTFFKFFFGFAFILGLSFTALYFLDMYSTKTLMNGTGTTSGNEVAGK